MPILVRLLLYILGSLCDGSSLRAVGVGPQGGAAEEWVSIISGFVVAAHAVSRSGKQNLRN